MSADSWRLVRIPATVRRQSTPKPDRGLRGLVKRLILLVLGPVADVVRGRIGVRVVRLPGRVLVLAESMDAIRGGVDLDRPALRRRVDRATLRLVWWRGPWRGWSGRVAPLRYLQAERVTLPLGLRGPATVDVRVELPTRGAELVQAAVAAVRPQWPLRRSTVDGGDRVLIDAEQVNPRGRCFDADQPWAPRYRLVFDRSGRPSLRAWRRGQADRLTWPAVSALRAIGVIDATGLPGRDPRAEAALVVQLAMTGVLVHAPAVPAAVGELLAPELRDILTDPVPQPSDVDTSTLELELRSVRQRRAALRGHSRGLDPAGLPPVSALLATRRPEHLTSILTAIAGQTYPQLEIVLCLHGIDLPEAAKHQLDACGRPYEVVRVDSDVSFGNALGIATARCGGTLVTKFDDDDTYGPEHVWDLVLARHYSTATLVGKGAEFVYLEDAELTIRRWSGRPEWDDTVVAGGTMLIGTADLATLGGWRPVTRSVDRGLVDRINRAGATIYRTHPMGYLYHRRGQGHTWDPGQDFFLRNTRARWPGLLTLPEFVPPRPQRP